MTEHIIRFDEADGLTGPGYFAIAIVAAAVARADGPLDLSYKELGRALVEDAGVIIHEQVDGIRVLPLPH